MYGNVMNLTCIIMCNRSKLHLHHHHNHHRRTYSASAWNNSFYTEQTFIHTIILNFIITIILITCVLCVWFWYAMRKKRFIHEFCCAISLYGERKKEFGKKNQEMNLNKNCVPFFSATVQGCTLFCTKTQKNLLEYNFFCRHLNSIKC